MSIVKAHLLIFSISALLLFTCDVASFYPPQVAKFMHARPQGKVGGAPETDVVMAEPREVEEPRLL